MKRLSIVLFIIIVAVNNAIAQCAMCTKTAQGLDPAAAKGINNAIIYLAVIPLAMILGVFYYMYRSAKANY
jgi:hypothetical protein